MVIERNGVPRSDLLYGQGIGWPQNVVGSSVISRRSSMSKRSL